MAWFADLAGRAETLLNNLDEQTGAALRSHSTLKQKKTDRHAIPNTENWNQKKFSLQRNGNKVSVATDTKANSTVKKTARNVHQSHFQIKDNQDLLKNCSPKPRRSPTKNPQQFSLNRCPRTMVGDVKDTDLANDDFALNQRRFSLPTDLELLNMDSLTYKMENLEVENAMLKNELNVLNTEVSGLVDRLRKSEDELSKSHLMLENTQLQYQRVNVEKDALNLQLEQLNIRMNDLLTIDLPKYQDLSKTLETEVGVLRERNDDLETRINELNEKTNEKNSSHIKLENELRHAQSTITDLQNDLERSTSECRRLERDWETYKLRVKSMLFAKDNEIKSLQEGANLTEDTKLLVEQLESLKEEREVLSEAITKVRNECADMKQHVGQLENRHNTAERVVTALRDALRDERAARNRTETQCIALGKELKSIQIEAGQTIASLRTALRDKENELHNLTETSSTSVRTTDTSALNVADYDVTIDNDKLHYLTETLVQKQGKIDSLMADNNMLRIQLDKLQVTHKHTARLMVSDFCSHIITGNNCEYRSCVATPAATAATPRLQLYLPLPLPIPSGMRGEKSKYKSEISSLRNNSTHSVVHFQEGECRHRTRNPAPSSALSKLSLRMGIALKRYPIFRVFIFIYMVGLHLWVLTVLFTSTPENVLTRPTKL